MHSHRSWRGYGKKSLRIALIGTGFMGMLHNRAYRFIPHIYPNEVLPSVEIVADVSDDLAERAARSWGIPRWTSDWATVLEDDEIDIVDICTPPDLHVPIGTAGAAAGKHVYCEKPLGRNSAETTALCDAVTQRGVASFVAFNYRWAPAVQYARELIAQGAVGEIWHVHATYNTGAEADPSSPWRWRYSRERAGHGALSDLGSHLFDMVRMLVGEINEITGYTDVVVRERPTERQEAEKDISMLPVTNDDSWGALFKLANGGTGIAEGSRVAAGTRVRFTVDVSGSKGALRWNLNRMNELEVYLPGASPYLDGFTRIQMGPGHPFFSDFLPVGGLGIGFVELKVLEQRAFLNAIAGGEVAAPSFEDGLVIARLLDRVATSGTVRAWQQSTSGPAR